jgi:transposase InsO family protein
VSRSGYYRNKKQKENEEIELEKAVIHCFKQHNGNYGRIRIRKTLLRDGINISEYRISRMLKKAGLAAKSGRTRKGKAPKPTEQQYIWCSDITELVCKVKFYLCGIIDVATRRLVGWAIAKNQTQKLVQDAFKMAVGRNPKRPEGAIFHSDRGSQYTAKKTKELIESRGFRKSMSRPGTPSDNQPIESFWRTLECEMPDIRHLTFDQASRTVVEYIELYYNSSRLHSGIGYNIPNRYFEFFTLQSVH